jgi:hypothetical protein
MTKKQKPTPPWSILDRSHPWVPSYLTDVRVTWEKARHAKQAPQTLPWRKP